MNYQKLCSTPELEFTWFCRWVPTFPLREVTKRDCRKAIASGQNFFDSLVAYRCQICREKWLYAYCWKGMEKLGHTYVNTIKRHWEVINHFWISLWSSLEYETEIQLQLQCSKYKYPFNWVKYLEWLFNIQSLAFQVKKKTSLRAYHKHHGTQERTDSNISTRLNRASHQIFAHK